MNGAARRRAATAIAALARSRTRVYLRFRRRTPGLVRAPVTFVPRSGGGRGVGVVWMRDRFYSTADLARMCGVGTSTIKRWTDAGLLRCVRTPGGHRKFRLQDVSEAARRLGVSMAGADPEPGARLDEVARLLLHANPAALAAQVAAALSIGDGGAVRRILLDSHRHGMRLAEIASDLLGAALAALHADRALDDFALRRAEQLSAVAAWHLLEHVPPQVAGAPTALVAAAAGARDALPRGLASLVLAEQGWRIVDLGSEVPREVLERGLERERPALLVLVLESRAEPDLASLERTAENRGARLVKLACDARNLPDLAPLRAAVATDRAAARIRCRRGVAGLPFFC